MTQLRVLIEHPMHTGRQKDANTGSLIPPHYIQRLKIEHNGDLLIDCLLSTGVSRDPYLAFRFSGGRAGDKINVSWQDNLGRTDQQETLVR